MTERGGVEAEGGARSSRNRSSLVLHAELIRLISLKICTLRSVLLRLFRLPGSGFIGENSGEFGELMKTVCLEHQRGAQLEQNFTSFKHTKKLASNDPSSDKRPHNSRK